MRLLWSVAARARLLLFRHRAEARMAEEFQFHLEMEAAQHARAGQSAAEARRQAVLAFGGEERHREAMRDGRGGRWLEDLARDLRHAARTLRARPGFTVVALLTIALGVGATTLVFSMVDALLLRPLAVPGADRLFAVTEQRSGAMVQGVEGLAYPYDRYEAYAEAMRPVFTAVAAQRLTSFSLNTGSESVAVRGVLTSGNYFGVLGLRPALGRFFLDERAEEVVLSYGLWRGRFGGDAGVLGRVVRLDGRSFTVAGVAPKGFVGTTPASPADLWVPLVGARGVPRAADMASWVAVFGRLRPGVPAGRAAALVDAVARRTPPDEPQTRVRGAALEPLAGVFRGGARELVRAVLALLLGAALLVLLIASANIAGMLLARGVARRREVAIRLALGAGRGRLVRQLLAESGLLALVGGVLGVAVAALGGRLVRTLPIPFLPSVDLDLALDLRVLGFALGLTAATALLFGLVPALHASRPRLLPALKDGGTGDPGRARGRSLFVAGQLGLAVFLLVVAGIFVRSFQRTMAADMGYDPAGVVVATVDLGPNGYDAARGRLFFDRLVAALRAVPGIDAVALAQAPLLDGSPEANDMEAVGGSGPRRKEWGVSQNRVGPGFFRLVRLPLVAGRGFTTADRAGAPPVTVINQTLARRLWPGEAPIGKQVSTFGGALEVVGVVRDGRYDFRSGLPYGYAFLPLAQEYRGQVTLHVRGRLPAAETIRRIRETVRTLDPDVAVQGASLLSAPVATLLAPQRSMTAMVALFGMIGLLLAGIGVYGVLAFQVAQRDREFGVRMALGAPRGAVVRQVLGRGALLAAGGGLAGLALGAGASVLLTGELYGVSAFEPTTFTAVPLLLVTVALVASFLPVRRATRVDPMRVLRVD